MSKLRVKCSCGKFVNTQPGGICPECKKPLEIPEEAVIRLHRKGAFLGGGSGFFVQINNEPMGAIGSGETLMFPVKYGTYTLRATTVGVHNCISQTVTLSPENRVANFRTWASFGMFSGFVMVEAVRPEEIPE